ncbi:MAG: hypothetical protein ACI81P_001090 [Neolewinella sp.]|jgi:hypothetical protein
MIDPFQFGNALLTEQVLQELLRLSNCKPCQRCDKMAVKRNNGGLDPSRFILENLGFLVFLGGLALLYIANAHYAEYNVRQIQVLEDEIKEKRWLYMSLQSENMYNGLRSEVVEDVRENGLRMHRGKPKKLVVKSK